MKPTLLVIDDDTKILKAASMYLSDFSVITAENGKIALDILASQQVDAILSDYNMPQMNGMEFAKSLKSQNKMIPIIIMSGALDKKLALSFANLRIHHVTEKPFDFDDISAIILEGIKISREDQENQKLATLGSNTGQIIHDLNNGLSIIKMSTELGLENSKDPSIVKNLTRSLRAHGQIESLITKYKKFFSGDNKVSLSKVCLHSFLHSNVDDFKTFVEGNKAQFTLNTELGGEELVHVDHDMLKQVVLNLLANSCDALRGTKSPWISMTVQSSESRVYIEVKDSGLGIDRIMKEQLFQPGKTTKGDKGTGMGLYYCKEILTKMFGEIRYNGEKNTSFIIELTKFKGNK